MGVLVGNVAGALSLRLISELTLKMVISVNLIGRHIFQLQKEIKRNLTSQEIDVEFIKLRESNDRKRIANIINSKRMANIDYKRNIGRIKCWMWQGRHSMRLLGTRTLHSY
jgi:hypothetical protein